MAGINRYSMAKKVLESHKDEVLGLNSLKEIIMVHLGSDDRTISTYLKVMTIGKLVENVSGDGGVKFKVL